MSLLFKRISIRGLELPNRIVMPPMGTQFATAEGFVTPRQIEYYARRARGGAGLVVVEFSAVDPVQVAAATQVRISDDRFIPGLSALASAIKANGARAAIQIHHPGRQASAKTTGAQPVAPSALAGPSPEVPRELSVAEIHEIEARFAQAAIRAKRAGFDAVELHGAHGYLICQFLSAYSNQRQDAYGGDTQRRARFALEVLGQVRQAVGRDFPIIFRFSADEHVPDGLSTKETSLIARWLEEAGADAISVSAGNHASMEWAIQPMLMSPGCLAPLAAVIKKAIKVPVIVAGRINDPLVAERILAQGKADLVAMGRGLLADPDLPEKAREGTGNKINKCIACNTCYDQILRSQPVACLVNPEAGRETEREKTTTDPKTVLVIGAGPAGLEAARVARLRGHDVTVWEEGQTLGGRWSWLIHGYVTVQRSRLKEMGVRLQTGVRADVTSAGALHPDVVLVTQGATPKSLSVAAGAHHLCDADEVLNGRKTTGERVVVIGGSNAGIEVADMLGRQGKKVTVAEPGPRAGSGLEWHARKMLLAKLAQRGVGIVTNVTFDKLEETTLTCRQGPGPGSLVRLDADSFVLALGSDTNEETAQTLKADFRVISLPYCERPADVFRAAQEGARAARGI
ncbi:MAG: FAD-dependent oxidoreductase [Chloroflexi bacterium]|nr:FAD-dependent oxidoreductase [Chloroflexota bacterium]